MNGGLEGLGGTDLTLPAASRTHPETRTWGPACPALPRAASGHLPSPDEGLLHLGFIPPRSASEREAQEEVPGPRERLGHGCPQGPTGRLSRTSRLPHAPTCGSPGVSQDP